MKNNNKSFLMPIMTVSMISGMAATIREIRKHRANVTVVERAKECEKLAEKFLTSYRRNEVYDDAGTFKMAEMLVRFNTKHKTEKPVILGSFCLWLAEDLESKRKPSDKMSFILPENLRSILKDLISSLNELYRYFDRNGVFFTSYDYAASMAITWKQL